MHHRSHPTSLLLPIVAFLLIAVAAPAHPIEIPDTPDGTARTVAAALADRHPEVLWQALPPTYQRDITELTHAFAGRMDPAVWQAAFGLGRRLVGILHDKKAIILSSSIVQSTGEQRQRIEDGWDSVIGVLDSFVSSDVSRLETLKTVDWERYLATTGRELMNLAAETSKARGDDAFEREFAARLRQTTVEVVSRDGDQATLRMTAPGEEPEELPLTRVEGRWVPSEMAADWNEKVAAAKQKLASLTDEEVAQGSAQAMAVIGMVDGLLTQLESVETSEQLEQAIQGMLGPLLGGFMQPGEGEAAIEEPAATGS
ncbi:MAG TPA: hypothetical protein PKJ99_12600 [Thermoanaerobaculales bacterium]|nr:hypothetical protein [Thermoanaerobaculales bacterium]HPA80872.1 hypothetical protein [Thermoanaerobaculales bacterium]HQL30828.1 hypothetical protein [Thermoanaerobaculales bacterium]HQN96309.1 hypothetical protein [Thermoanaerobaculales bacterium]HQP44109.1 hypothetical protein [Thermoanaerobaculales bacterium]